MSSYNIEGTQQKTKAVDLSTSTDFDASFTKEISSSKEKFGKVYNWAQRIHNDMKNILIDNTNLPASLRVKMPEFNNMVAQLRSLVISRGFIATMTWEKRMMVDATKMLSAFLFHVLRENQMIIERCTELMDEAQDDGLKLKK